jgi:hypothetical protein
MTNLAWRNIAFDQAYGFALTYFDYGKLDKRTDNGTPIGEFYPMDARVTGNYARKITPNIYVGANLNFIYQKIDTSSSNALALDLGVAYLTPLLNTSVDIALKNLRIFSSKMDQEATELPQVYDFGISAGFEVFEQMTVSPAVKLVYMDDHDNMLPALGIKAKLYDMLSVRMGYKFNYNEEDLSAGIGILFKDFSIDYSYLNNEIDGVHMIGVGYKF